MQTKFIYSTVHIKVQYTKANPNDPFFVNSKSNKLFYCFCFLPTVQYTVPCTLYSTAGGR